jgi:hypothetical protein
VNDKVHHDTKDEAKRADPKACGRNSKCRNDCFDNQFGKVTFRGTNYIPKWVGRRVAHLGQRLNDSVHHADNACHHG